MSEPRSRIDEGAIAVISAPTSSPLLLDVSKSYTPSAVVKFSYPAIPSAASPAWDGLVLHKTSRDIEGSLQKPDSLRDRDETAPAPDFEHRLAQETARSYEAGHTRGFEEGRAAEREHQRELQRQEMSARLSVLAESIAQAQMRYFESIEPKLARLALEIASRILRRELQLDPLLLTGAVRAALGQIAASSRVRLLVPPDDLSLWTEAVALLPDLPLKPLVVAGERMQPGECRLESDLGSADLGVFAQLSVIERTLFDASGPCTAPLAQARNLPGEDGTR